MDQFLHVLLPDALFSELRDIISGLVLMEKIELITRGVDHPERECIVLINGDLVRYRVPDPGLCLFFPEHCVDQCALSASGSAKEHYIDPAVIHVNDLFVP